MKNTESKPFFASNKEKFLNLIQPIDGESEYGVIYFIYSIRRALALTETLSDRDLVMERTVKCLNLELFEDLERKYTWYELKPVLFFVFEIDDSLEEVKARLGKVKMGRKTFENYYKKVQKLTRDLMIMEYDARKWNEIDLVIEETEKIGLNAFIKGLDEKFTEYLTDLDPKTTKEAYEIIKTLDKLMNFITSKKLQVKNYEKMHETPPCPTLLLKTSLSPTRKFLFHVWQFSPANLIKLSSLPPETFFARFNTKIRTNYGFIDVIGQIYLYFQLDEKTIGPIQFYILPLNTQVEDDGIVQLNFGMVSRMNDGFVFSYRTHTGAVKQLRMGMDCPKRGKCRHFPLKQNIGAIEI